jgi:hypothetical protein
MVLSDASKTAFATYKGLFEFKRMLMGLSNDCASFERLMEYYFLLNILSLLSIISDMDKNIKLKFDENKI